MRIMKFIWNFVQSLLFIHCITLMLLILNKHVPVLFLVVEGYCRRLFEIAIWPVIDFFCGSDTKNKLWDTGWHHAFVSHIVNLIRYLGCLIFLPLHYSSISSGLKVFFDILLDFLRCAYEFLTFEILIYIYLACFFANKIISGTFRRLKNSNTTGLSSRPQRHNHRDSSYTVTDDDDDDEYVNGFYNDDDESALPLMVNSLGFLSLERRSHLERMCCMCSHYGDHSVMLPCGHTDLCFNCAFSYHIMELACPFCATNIQSCHRILL